MRFIVTKSCRQTLLLATLAAAATPALSGQTYNVGDVVSNFTLTDRATNEPVSLYDLEGKVIFLEWFAWWCPFCKASAARTVPDIEQYYAGGNAHNVPVAYIAINLQGNAEQQTQQFIDTYGIGQVLNDFDASVASRFQLGGQPIFAVINGVADSPGHKQWELVYSLLGYGSLSQPIEEFRNAIDSVLAPVVAPPPSDPPAILQQPLSQTIAPGTPVTLSVDASGDGTLQYQWKRDGAEIPGATSAQLDLGNASSDMNGYYTVDVTDDAGTTTSRFARLVVATPDPGYIVNLSVRAAAGDETQPLIVGFVVDGGAKQLLVRGIGPTLATFGVTGALPDPTLRLYSGSDLEFENDDWASDDVSALTDAIGRVGAFSIATDSKDAGILTDISGPHTAHLAGKTGTSGISLVEVYDAGSGDSAHLSNVSARNQVGTGDNVLVAGFVVSGNEPRRLLVRAVGPGLEPFGVTGVLEDPYLEIHTNIDNVDTIAAANDNWEDEPNAAEASTAVPGAFALTPGSKDSTLLVTLPAGAYTALVRGANGETGEALVEIYQAP